MRLLKISVKIGIILVICCFTISWGRGMDADIRAKSFATAEETADVQNDNLQNVAVHDAGDLYCPFSNNFISTGYIPYQFDPETGFPLERCTYPKGSGKTYIFGGGVWVGGIVNGDTLVSVSQDGWLNEEEFFPENYGTGSMYRIGQFADDEFNASVQDTFDCSLRFGFCSHNPMGIELKQITRNWADPYYDDFIIVDYEVTNVGDQLINDGWAGVYFDGDVLHNANSTTGFMDDCAGTLDTLLNPSDPESRALIAYIFDNDGDPSTNGGWDTTSVRGAISLSLLGTSFDVEHLNFNWWISSSNVALDFGPRQLGTPEDPFRNFGGNLGTPMWDKNKYYILSHSETDYDQLLTAVMDSAAGWVPATPPARALDLANGYDVRFLLSFGPFDLAPGESATFSLALVAGDNVHVGPFDFSDFYDSFDPSIFYDKLDFSELVLNHRRAYETYQSGYTLPHPGPPQGLAIVDYDDDFVDLTWNASQRPDLVGYYVSYRDTDFDNQWHHLNAIPITKTTYRFWPAFIDHNFELAVSLMDDLGRESGLSMTKQIIPATPHSPKNLRAVLDGLTPVLTWEAYSDTVTVTYLIYRAINDGGYVLHDSTMATTYRDNDAESGYIYNYKISAKNDLMLESGQVGPVWVLPMALNHGALFVDQNPINDRNRVVFDPDNIDQLYSSIASYIGLSRHNIYDQTPLDLKLIADYNPLIISSESFVSSVWSGQEYQPLRYYLENGGSAIVICLAAYEWNLGMGEPFVVHFKNGDIFHDIFKLDSSLLNLYNIDPNTHSIWGDLASCEPLVAGYEWLHADTNKFNEAIVPIDGFIPMSGAMYPSDEVEPIYKYISNNPDTIFHEQINGIRYLGDDYKFVMLNFPVSLMQEPASVTAIVQALKDLGFLPTGADDDGNLLPEKFSLHQNYPNPFNPQTTIEFYNADSKPVEASLNIYNILGQRVMNLLDGLAESGLNRLIWDGKDEAGKPVATGIYFYRLKIEDTIYTRKMALVR